MTESDWLSATDPQPMLEHLRGTASDRKLRLFAVACCRCIWQLLDDERSRTAVNLSEKFADGLVGADTLSRAVKAAPMPEWPGSGPKIFDWKLVTTGIAADMTDPRTYVWLTGETSQPELTPYRIVTKWAEDGQQFVDAESQVIVIHDLFGNPFRPVAFADSWRSEDAVALASAIYAERAFDRMPILADALEEAGCDHPDVLAHCRSSGPHARGCWVVDGVLGKR